MASREIKLSSDLGLPFLPAKVSYCQYRKVHQRKRAVLPEFQLMQRSGNIRLR